MATVPLPAWTHENTAQSDRNGQRCSCGCCVYPGRVTRIPRMGLIIQNADFLLSMCVDVEICLPTVYSYNSIRIFYTQYSNTKSVSLISFFTLIGCKTPSYLLTHFSSFTHSLQVLKIYYLKKIKAEQHSCHRYVSGFLFIISGNS